MLFMRKGGRTLLVASLGVGAISYVACGGSAVANLTAPPQQDAGAEHPPDATQDGTTETPDTGPEPRRAAALGRPVAQELFELELYGDNVERRYRRMRPEVEAMPWGTFDTRGLPEAAVTLARKQWTSAASRSTARRSPAPRHCGRSSNAARRWISSRWRAASRSTRWSTAS
jgi:hypothetical protein